MAEQNVIQSLLDDLQLEQPIVNAVCIGQDLSRHTGIDWQYFSVNALLNLPFETRYDLAFVTLDSDVLVRIDDAQKTQMLVKLRDLWAKRMVVVSALQDEQLLRSLGFTQLIDKPSTMPILPCGNLIF